MKEKAPVKEPEERLQFQVDRLAFFSDAVIAIAITLLILEVKITPLGVNTTWRDLPRHFSHQTGMSLLGMLICFLSIGNLWLLHHELFRHVNNYNKRLVKVNLYFLLSIMVLPLSISFGLDADNPHFLPQAQIRGTPRWKEDEASGPAPRPDLPGRVNRGFPWLL